VKRYNPGIYTVDEHGRPRKHRVVNSGKKNSASEIIRALRISKREQDKAKRILLEMGLIHGNGPTLT
jgi:hypothetical protein